MLNIFVSRNIWKTAFLPLLDFINLLFAAGIVYVLRYQVFDESFEGVKLISGLQFFIFSALTSITIILIIGLLRTYSISQKPKFYTTLININIAIWITILSLIAYLYFNEYNPNSIFQNVKISRFIVGIYGFVAFCSVFIGRLIFMLVEDLLYRNNIGTYNVIVIGKNNNKTKLLLKKLNSQNFIKNIYLFEKLTKNLLNDQITNIIERQNCGEIYMFCNDNSAELENKISILAERKKIRFLFSPDGFNNFDLYSVNPIKVANMHFFEMNYSKLVGWQIVLKRVFDLSISILFVILFSWLYLIIAILIKLDSKGSIFYPSERVGSNGKIFKMFKFRRFKQEYCTSELNPSAKSALEFEQELIKSQGEAANRGALYKIKQDPRMTKIGQWLEKTSLDELPQFFNVIIGNLSLVGPRAHQPREVKKYEDHHYKVLNIKPGITGLAQIKGRSDLHFEDEVKYDTFYVQNWSFFMDIWILIKTPIVIFFTKHKS